MWHGLPAREITAKMAVPPIKQLRLNTYPQTAPSASFRIELKAAIRQKPAFLG